MPEKFEWKFTDENGEQQVLRLKPASMMPFRLIRTFKDDADPDKEQMIRTLDWAAGDDQRELLDQLPQGDWFDMFKAWQVDGGITVGESAASSST